MLYAYMCPKTILLLLISDYNQKIYKSWNANKTMKTLKNIVYSTLTAGVLAMVPGCSTIEYGNKVDLEGIARWEPHGKSLFIGDMVSFEDIPAHEFYFCLDTKEYGVKEVNVKYKKPHEIDSINKNIYGVIIGGVPVKLKNIPSERLKKKNLTVRPDDVEIMKPEIK